MKCILTTSLHLFNSTYYRHTRKDVPTTVNGSQIRQKQRQKIRGVMEPMYVCKVCSLTNKVKKICINYIYIAIHIRGPYSWVSRKKQYDYGLEKPPPKKKMGIHIHNPRHSSMTLHNYQVSIKKDDKSITNEKFRFTCIVTFSVI